MREFYHFWRRMRVRRSFPVIMMAALGIGIIGLTVWHTEKQELPTWSWSLGDKTILIDAGHGGVDPGAVSKSNNLEKDITLAVSKRLQVMVSQGGGKPVMVREEDKDLGSGNNLLQRKREDLSKRLQLAADSQADVYLSIHVNSYPNASLKGPQTFYLVDSPEGKELALALQQELNELSGGKRVSKSNKELFILKKANQAAVTIELGFISNAEEEKLLIDADYQEKLAWAIYKGLCQYFSKTVEFPGT